jgi:hypothetical protein
VSWWQIVLSCWPGLAIPAALIIGRMIDRAERRERQRRGAAVGPGRGRAETFSARL